MIPKMVDVLLHVDEDLSDGDQGDLDDAVREVNGVFSVHIPPRRSHLMLVEYNPDWTSSERILRSVTGKGLHAELVGL